MTAYQILLAIPPIGRRNSLAELERIDPEVIQALLSGIPPDLLLGALAERNWPPAVRRWLLKPSPSDLTGDHHAEALTGMREGCPYGPKTTQLLGRLIQGLARTESLLPIPTAWIGGSCLDLRIEHRSCLAADHLATWPDPEDLASALCGLSAGNQQRILGRLDPERSRLLVNQIALKQGGRSWKQILQAQRRIAWWLNLVDFSPKILAL